MSLITRFISKDGFPRRDTQPRLIKLSRQLHWVRWDRTWKVGAKMMRIAGFPFISKIFTHPGREHLKLGAGQKFKLFFKKNLDSFKPKGLGPGPGSATGGPESSKALKLKAKFLLNKFSSLKLFFFLMKPPRKSPAHQLQIDCGLISIPNYYFKYDFDDF